MHIFYICHFKGIGGLLIFFSFIFISWRLITLQYCSGFCHTLTWISHGVACIPHPDTASHLPLHPIPLGLPSAPGLSTCLFFFFIIFSINQIMHTLKSFFLFYWSQSRLYNSPCIHTHTHGIIVLYVCDIDYVKVTEKVKNGNILFGC